MSPDESRRRSLVEPVRLLTYDVDWPKRFVLEHDRLLSRFGDRIMEVRHFGSTAVPGMTAKPTIDMIAGLRDEAMADDLIWKLSDFGYCYQPDLDTAAPERRFLFRHATGHRTHHLHLVKHGGQVWRDRLEFCEILRADVAVRSAYQALKIDLADRFHQDRERYTSGKGEFILRTLSAHRKGSLQAVSLTSA